jgi:hypothetical protein
VFHRHYSSNEIVHGYSIGCRCHTSFVVRSNTISETLAT